MSDGVELIWHGFGALRTALSDIETRMERAVAGAVAEAAALVQTTAREAIHEQTGRLARSIKADRPVKVGFAEYKAEIGPEGVKYARVVELGKRGYRHRRPHPYLMPGYRIASEHFAAIFRDAWKGAL